MREMGNVDLIRDVTRETWGYLWVERLAQDLKYSLRQLRNSPGFAVAVMGTLALGLGAAAAMFTVVDRVLLRPLPYQDPHALVQILEAGSKRVSWGAPFVDLQQWRLRSHAFTNIAFHQENGQGRLDFLEGQQWNNTGDCTSTEWQSAPHPWRAPRARPGFCRGPGERGRACAKMRTPSF